MAVLIKFDQYGDRLLAIDILADEDETYHGVPPECFLISNAAARLLSGRGVRFRVINRTGEEEGPHAPSP